jgi:hypothetical protein
MTMKKILIGFLMLSSVAFADSGIPKYNSIAEMVETEGNQQVELIYRNETKSEAQINDSWYFNLVRLRITALVGLEVPLFLSFEVGPRIEFRFKRKTPEGYTDYAVK